MNTRCLRYTVSGQAKALSIPPGEYAGNGETQRKRPGKKRDTLLYYIGEIYRGEGKGGLLRKGGKGDAEGRGIYREREEKGHFGEEKGMFRGRERDVSGRKIAEGIGIGREIN